MRKNKKVFILILILALTVLIIASIYYFIGIIFLPGAPPPPRELLEGVAPPSELVKGEILPKIPEEMRVGIKERIKVDITEKFKESIIEEKFKDKIKEIYIGTSMKVLLKGNNFKIEELNNPVQLVLKGRETQWNWDVIPLRSGNQLLSLIVSIVITLPNDIKDNVDYYVFDNPVKVKPNLIYSAQIFIYNYWQAFVFMLVGLFAKEIFNKIKNSKKVKRPYVKKP